MGQILDPTIIEIYMCDPTGVRIELLDYVTKYQYGKITKAPAPCILELPDKFNRSSIKLDNIIEIWYGFGPGTLRLDYCGFLRDWEFGDENGIDYTRLLAWSPKYLSSGRIVANYAGSAQADMTDQADDMVKAIAKDQMGADTTAARNLTSVGGGFTIQADLADGQSLTKAFAYKGMMDICQEICDASTQAGTEVYYDIVPVISSSVTGTIAFQLQTFTDQRGNDRTWDSSQPVFVGKEWGNFRNGLFGEYHSEEINYVYALGQGEGASREIVEVSDTARIGMSIWNRREGAKDSRQVDYGDTAALTGEANTFLNENKPKFRLSGDIVETPSFLYKRDWDYGDKVTAIYAGFQRDASINIVAVEGDSEGKNITARLEIEE